MVLELRSEGAGTGACLYACEVLPFRQLCACLRQGPMGGVHLGPSEVRVGVEVASY